jgi:two-component system sensor histidine kinase BaeS
LAVRGSEIHIDTLAEAFQSGQRQTYGLIAALVVLLSSLSSLYLARRLLRPIRWLADGAQALAAGDYDTRIEVERDDELGRLARHFNHLAAALARNEQLRRQWIADISHELRTPLAVLRGEIEALQDGVRAVSAQRLNSLHAEALALGQLVEDLYQLALADAGALEYRCESVDLAEILTDTAQAFRHRFEQQGLTLDNQVAAPLWLHGDPLRLQQLFSNLLENSQRYTAAGGRLEIVLERSVERHVLVFRDSAPAVPDAALSHLFERLYRVDKSRSRSLGGAGLGLALCQNIVEAHGGRMTASHSPLGGLQVRVELPVQGAGFERRSR